MIPLIDSSSNSEMTSLIVTASALAGLMGANMAQMLISQLGLNAPPAIRILPIPVQVSMPLRACISPTLQGQMKILFAQSKVLEYLCGLAGYLGAQLSVPDPGSPSRKRERMRELHATLMQLEGKLPSIDELGARFGMSARWLNSEFVLEYGLPIYAFITDLRLNEAHAALLKSDVPIKSLALRLGYSHVAHFTNTFKKKFGYPPGSLRRGRPTQEG